MHTNFKLAPTLLLMAYILSSCSKNIDPTLVDSITGYGTVDSATLARQQAVDYNGVPASKRFSFFRDDFSDNTNDWPLVASPYANEGVKIVNGSYAIYESDIFCYLSTVMIDQNRDFEIEASIRQDNPDAEPRGADYIVWGFDATAISVTTRPGAGWGLDYDNSTSAIEKAVLVGSMDWTNFQSLASEKFGIAKGSATDASIITIRRIGDKVHIFCDGKLVWSLAYTPSGNLFGFKTNSGRMYVDWVNVDYLQL